MNYDKILPDQRAFAFLNIRAYFAAHAPDVPDWFQHTPIRVTPAPTRWNLSPEDAIAEQRKALEKRLRAIPAGTIQIDQETGETFYGPVKTSTSTYKITLSK